MTEEQNRRYTPLKQAIDVLDEQLLNEIHAKQEQIAPVQEGSPGYLALNDQLITLQKRRCDEPNRLTYHLIEQIVTETGMNWNEAVKRNNDARNLKGADWVRFILD